MTENTSKFPEYDSCIEDDFEADLQEEIGSYNLRAIKSRIALKPCPFCGDHPELNRLSGAEDALWCVRCFSGFHVCVETAWHKTPQSAAATWNKRVVDHSSFFSKLLKNPAFLVFAAGFSMLAIGVGFDKGTAYFFSVLGVGFVFISSILAIHSLPDSSAQSSQQQDSSDKDLESKLVKSFSSIKVTLRPDLPSCPLCGDVPFLHEIGSGRFYVLCSNSRCWGSSKLQSSHYSAEEAVHVWAKEYVPEVQKNRAKPESSNP